MRSQKNQIQQLISYYLHLKGINYQLEKQYKNTVISAYYQQCLVPAQEILVLCDDNLLKAEVLLDKMKNKKYIWDLSTVVRKYLELI